jgi:hypothetical protein
MERIAIECRMEAPERARSMAARAARPTSFSLAAEPLNGPPGRGDFLVSNFHPDWTPVVAGGSEEVVGELLKPWS